MRNHRHRCLSPFLAFCSLGPIASEGGDDSCSGRHSLQTRVDQLATQEELQTRAQTALHQQMEFLEEFLGGERAFGQGHER